MRVQLAVHLKSSDSVNKVLHDTVCDTTRGLHKRGSILRRISHHLILHVRITRDQCPMTDSEIGSKFAGDKAPAH